MSWKSLVCAGLLCALAMPVMAAPAVTIDLVRSGGVPLLDANGDWQWEVSITPDAADVTAGKGSMDAELAFILTGAGLVSASMSNTSDWDHDTPAVDPSTGVPAFGDFSWLVPTWPTGTPIYTEGLVSDTTADEVLASYGSINFTTATPSQYLTIITEGPSTAGSLTTAIQMGGAYGGNGRIAQNEVKYDIYGTTISKTVLAGNANFDGIVDGADLVLLSGRWLTGPGNIWTQGNFNGDADVDGADLVLLSGQWLNTQTPPGSGALLAGAIPEPSSLLLLVCGGLLALAKRRYL